MLLVFPTIMIEVLLVVAYSFACTLIILLWMLGCHGFDIGAISASFPFWTRVSTGKAHITIANLISPLFAIVPAGATTRTVGWIWASIPVRADKVFVRFRRAIMITWNWIIIEIMLLFWNKSIYVQMVFFRKQKGKKV